MNKTTVRLQSILRTCKICCHTQGIFSTLPNLYLHVLQILIQTRQTTKKSVIWTNFRTACTFPIALEAVIFLMLFLFIFICSCLERSFCKVRNGQRVYVIIILIRIIFFWLLLLLLVGILLWLLNILILIDISISVSKLDFRCCLFTRFDLFGLVVVFKFVLQLLYYFGLMARLYAQLSQFLLLRVIQIL